LQEAVVTSAFLSLAALMAIVSRTNAFFKQTEANSGVGDGSTELLLLPPKKNII